MALLTEDSISGPVHPAQSIAKQTQSSIFFLIRNSSISSFPVDSICAEPGQFNITQVTDQRQTVLNCLGNPSDADDTAQEVLPYCDEIIGADPQSLLTALEQEELIGHNLSFRQFDHTLKAVCGYAKIPMK